MPNNSKFETVIGLEVHVELKTESKIFCACSTAFGAEPNTQCCPVCMGLPGTLPVLNRRVVELAVKAGVALGCEIAETCRMDRKHYFYPDLPKAYQISQAEYPICRNGSLTVTVEGEARRVGITRIHIEEDAGKLLHEEGRTLADYNRCGVPLIEIVSEPDLRSGAEAAAYLRELRSILLACGISDCKMQEGSMRCDVNLSVRKRGSNEMGIRTEIKNLNSFSFVQKAVEAEAKRQIGLLTSGCEVEPCTMRFLPREGKTEVMRKKERGADYRFLPEPDLLPFRISRETVERMQREVPMLPAEKRMRIKEQYGAPPNEAALLAENEGLFSYFEHVVSNCIFPKIAMSLLLSDLLRFCEEEPFSAPVRPERLAELANLVGEGTLNRTTAKKLLARLTESDFSPREIAEREGLVQIRDRALISAWVVQILESEAQSVADYLGGKKAAIRALQGKLMAKSGGRADAVLADEILMSELQKKEESKNV